MKKTTSLVKMTRTGILTLSLIFSAVFNLTYGQYTIDGNNCVGGSTIEWPLVADAVDSGDVSVPSSADINRLWFNVHEETLQFAFTRASTTTGNSAYAIYFNGDCDNTTGDMGAGGAEYAMFFNVTSGTTISNTEVYYYISGSWNAQGINFAAALGDSACGTDRNFFEFGIAADSLFPDVCAIGNSSCGSIEITRMETYAGGSFNSAPKDVLEAGIDAFINDAPVARVDADPVYVCHGSSSTISAALSTENTDASRNTTYDEIVKFEWDWNYTGTFSADYTYSATSTTSAQNTLSTGVLTTGATTATTIKVALRVTDKFDCESDILELDVVVVPNPKAFVDAVYPDSSGLNWRCRDWVWYHEVDQLNTKDYLGNAITDFSWALPDGSTITGDNATHQYSPNCWWQYAQADRVVTLTATDQFGCEASTTFTPSPVPVDLTSFNGDVIEGAALLKWQTASELNSENFVIERSTDANNFEEIGTVLAAGHSNEVLDYSFMDVEMPEGNVYYRLVQYDFNGEFKVYDPIVLNQKADEGRVRVTPNPGMDKVEVHIPMHTAGGELVILDMTGKQVFNATVGASSKNTSVSVDISALPRGLYYVRYGNMNEGFTSELLQLL